MRILQLIDTLHPGGAERMAVSYANILANSNYTTFLVATREEGLFKKLINPKIQYLYLNKKNTFDVFAFFRLWKFIKKNKINVIHAHSSSWFLAVIMKLTSKKIKLIWHDHFGNSEYLESRARQPLHFFSQFFDGIISVNDKLKNWAKYNLKVHHLIYISNFIIASDEKYLKPTLDRNFIHLVCLANLRRQKDHLMLLKAGDLLSEKYPIKLHLIGKDFKDSYSEKLSLEFKKRNYIVFHGAILNPMILLKQMNIGVLSSRSEGLPVSILEYATAGLPVVCTNVGECLQVLGENAKLVRAGDFYAFTNAIAEYIENPDLASIESESLRRKIRDHYSDKAVLPVYLNFLRQIK